MSIPVELKNRIKSTFPNLVQIMYERNVNKKVKEHKVDTLEERKENLAKIYKEYTGHEINWDDPKRYTEKIQLRKLYNKNEAISTLSDKYEARKWVEKTIGEEHLIPLLGAWDSFDEIDFSTLPDSFILKTNNASGTNYMVLDKSKMNLKLMKRKFDFWMQLDYANFVGYEMQYEPIKPKIICEEILPPNEGGELRDYKFFCFNGTAEYMFTVGGRGKNTRRLYLDKNYNPLNWTRDHYPIDPTLNLPENIDEIRQIAEKLSKGINEVRVDLYCTNGTIYFGEMTFTDASGLLKFEPDEVDFILGELWDKDENGVY